MNKTFIDSAPKVTKGYQGFPLDHLVNFTSVCGYLIPIFKQILDPGDKVTIKNLLRTRTQPFTKPAMATIIERIEWFAVPIEQLYKAFSPKYFGINDVETDMYPVTFQSDHLPYIGLETINNWMRSLPTSFEAQSNVPSNIPTFAEAKRLCDALGYPLRLGCSTLDGDGNQKEWTHSVSALFPAAYQKIYYDHYRLTDRVVNDPAAYNLDSFYNNAVVTNTGDRLSKLLHLRKRPYQRDYFTSTDVAPLFGSQSDNASGIDLGQVNQWLSGLSGIKTSSPLNSTNYPDGGNTSLNNTSPSTVIINRTGSGSVSQGSIDGVMSVINPANIRSLFAVEKLLQVTRKAKKHYDKQVLAHFGVSVPKGLAGECLKLGTHEQYIQIGDVTATATVSGGSALGQLAGTGASKGSMKPIHFEAKCHCILMGIYSAEPLMNYSNTGLDRLNTMVRASDFYKSEFDDLGQQPKFAFELYDDAVDLVNNPSEFDGVVGWDDRYLQLKAMYNRSFAGCATDYFKEWSLNRNITATTIANFSRKFFEVWPTDLNNILQVPYTGAVAPISTDTGVFSTYALDYLISQAYIDVVKVSKKSIHGTPNLY